MAEVLAQPASAAVTVTTSSGTRAYETLVIIRPDITEDQLAEIAGKIRDYISQTGSNLIGLNPWGKRRLAYTLEKHKYGYFAAYYYVGKPDSVAQIERNLRLNESILRFMTTFPFKGVIPQAAVDGLNKPISAWSVVAEEEEERPAGRGGRGGHGGHFREDRHHHDREPRHHRDRGDTGSASSGTVTHR